ncbi:MAG: CP family cyanate transporter-like MFS transporter [Maribacter sp.]
MSLIGFFLGGTFELALLFIVLRSMDSESATELSGKAQSIGYFVAATGPFVFGAVFDVTQSWTYLILLLFAIAFITFFVGLGAGKPGKAV